MTPFRVLFREFASQFFASESTTSDHQLRVAIIGVFVFLVMPGLLLPIQLTGVFEWVSLRHPELMTTLVQVVATIFLTYGIVTTGVIAAFTWDGLGFGRRDAMVLGPLPVDGRTVIAAKLCALAALLLSCAAAVNVLTALPFALLASTHAPFLAMVRHFLAHLTASMSAAAFVFAILVTIRALVGMAGRGRVAIATLVQFVLVGALLCFIVALPAMASATRGRRGADRVYLLPIPEWSPTNWFLGLHEVVRGSGAIGAGHAARIALTVTATAIAVAIAATVVSYRRQMQLALTPSAAPGARRTARALAALARTLAGPDRIARAVADFVVSTLLRNRAQQVPIVLNGAMAVAIAAAGLTRPRRGDLFMPRTIVLWMPLLAAYWTAIGTRAAFFVPADLPAGWVFRANAPASCRAYWIGTRAAMIALLVPASAAVAAIAMPPLVGWRVAGPHIAFVAVMTLALCELLAQTIDFVPFTRPYPPGHAKLKSRWPLYLAGMFAFAIFPVRAELHALGGGEPQLLAWVLGVALALHAAGGLRARRWSLDPRPDQIVDRETIAVLDLRDMAESLRIG